MGSCATPAWALQHHLTLHAPPPPPPPPPRPRFDLGSILTRAHSAWHKTQPVPPGMGPAAAPGDTASSDSEGPLGTALAPFSGGAIVDENGGWAGRGGEGRGLQRGAWSLADGLIWLTLG